MASSLGEVLADHEEFVSKQLAELRHRLLAEHRRQVSALWHQLDGGSRCSIEHIGASRGSIEHAGTTRGSIESLPGGRGSIEALPGGSHRGSMPRHARGSTSGAGNDFHHGTANRGSMVSGTNDFHQSSAAPRSSRPSITVSVSRASSPAPGDNVPTLPSTPAPPQQNCPPPPLDLHPATLGVIGESDELAQNSETEQKEHLDNTASFISLTSSDGGGCEVGLMSFDDGSPGSRRGSAEKRSSGGPQFLVQPAPQSEQASTNHPSKDGGNLRSESKNVIHVHYTDSDGNDKKHGSRRGSGTGSSHVHPHSIIKSLKSDDSQITGLGQEHQESGGSKHQQHLAVQRVPSGTSSHCESVRSFTGRGDGIRNLRHLHVVHGGPSPMCLTPMPVIASNPASRSASRLGGYASTAHSQCHSLAASRRGSVTSCATQATILPMQLQRELQDEFNMDHYCTPVLRLSKGMNTSYGGAHLSRQEAQDGDMSDESSEESISDEGREKTANRHSGGSMNRMSTEGDYTCGRRSTEPEELQGGFSSQMLSETGDIFDPNMTIRLLPIWIGKKKSNSKRMPSAAHSVRSYTNTMSVFDKEPQSLKNHPWVFRPGSLTHVTWSIIGLITIIYDCVAMPLEVFDLQSSIVMEIIGWIIRCYWMVNVGVSFRTGFLTQKGTVEMRVREIAIKYSRTWLPLDVFTIVLDWIDLLNNGRQGQLGDTARALRVLRTLRLARLIRAPEFAALVTDHIINSEQVILVAHIAKIMTVMLWVVHCIACFWYGISTLDANQGWAREEGILDLSTQRKYAWSFHWSLMAFFGNTLVFPTNVGERSFTICVLFLAFLVSATFVSSMTTSMTRLQLISSQQSSQFAALRKYLLDHNITRPLAQRVMRNAQYAMVEMKRNAPESSIELLGICSVPLRIELHYQIHSRVILNHPFFYCYNAVNPAGMRQICHTAVSLLLLTTGDIIFTDCEVPAWPRMFFVVSGRFFYMQEGKKAKIEVESGQWFCEGVLWAPWMHRGTMAAADESQLLMVDAVKFQNIVSAFHTDHPRLYAQEYVKSMNQARRTHYLGITDLGDTDEYIEERIFKVFQEMDDEEDCRDEERRHSDRDSTCAAKSNGIVKFSLFKRKKPQVDHVSSQESAVSRHSSGSKRSADNQRKRRISTVRRSLEFLDKLKETNPNHHNGTASLSGFSEGVGRKMPKSPMAFSVTSSIRSWLPTGPAFGTRSSSKSKVTPAALQHLVQLRQTPDIIPIKPCAQKSPHLEIPSTHLEALVESPQQSPRATVDDQADGFKLDTQRDSQQSSQHALSYSSTAERVSEILDCRSTGESNASSNLEVALRGFDAKTISDDARTVMTKSSA